MSATAICHHKSNQAVHPSKMRNALWVLRLILLVFLPRAASFPLFRANSNILEVGAERNLEKKDVLLSTTGSFDRRDMFRLVSAFMLAVPFPAGAGEVGARITKAVTTSDVGVSVRTSVGTSVMSNQSFCSEAILIIASIDDSKRCPNNG